jgi:hypothetical protein
MVLFIHIFIGAVIAAKITYLPLALILALLSHYILDLIPHTEYPIKHIKEMGLKGVRSDILSIMLDLLLGLILILTVHFLVNVDYIRVFFVSFFALLPDCFTFMKYIFPKNRLLKGNFWLLHYKSHFLNRKKIPFWGKIIFQILVLLVGFAVLC